MNCQIYQREINFYIFTRHTRNNVLLISCSDASMSDIASPITKRVLYVPCPEVSLLAHWVALPQKANTYEKRTENKIYT